MKTTKNFFVVIALLILMSSIAYMALSPPAHAAVITNSQKTTNILGNIVGLNMNSYTTELTSDVNTATNPAPVPTATLGLPQETVMYNLTGTQGSLRASCSFINGNLNQIYLSNYVGSPSLSQTTTNTLDMAQGFLQRYQSYTGNQLYSSLSSMLTGIAINTNTTETAGNIKLQVSNFGNEQDLIWTYVDNNGIPALSKDVVLTYNNGLLESFLDNWQLYQIGGVPELSNQDATAIALQAVQNYSYVAYNVNGANVTVSGFKVASIGNVSLSYLNYYEQTPEQSIRGGNSLILYPSWYVAVGFDKVYPGNVTGLIVNIWADTGNVSSITPMAYQAPASSTPSLSDTTTQVKTNQVSMMIILLPITAIAASSITGAYLYSKKNKLNGLNRTWTFNLSKRKIAAICLILLPIGVIIAVPITEASTIKSEIYVSTYQETSLDTQEDSYASSVASYIQMLYTQYDGVSSNNNYGSATNYNNIMYNIMYDESNYMGVVVFHFGHGYVPDYIDSNGNLVSYSNIASSTNGYNEHYFVWMWTCTLAQDYNFAHAWTQKSSLSSDGFNYPDSTSHSFIGFTGESPTISYQSFEGYSQLAYLFIEWFYYYSVYSSYNVHDALNLASQAVFGVSYNSSPLTSYNAWWPGGDGIPAGWFAGQMKIYGDAAIMIKQ